MDTPVTKGEKFNVAELSLLRDFWGNNYAHIILTEEADSLPTDEQKLLDDYGLLGCHSSRSNDLSVHARNLIPQDMFAFYGSQRRTEMDMLQSFEVKFGNTTEGATTKSRERSAEQPLTHWIGVGCMSCGRQ